MGPAGFDTDTGFGLIHADAALNCAARVRHHGGAERDAESGHSGRGGEPRASTAADSFGHTLTYAWTSTCTGGLPPGSFDDPSAADGDVDGAGQLDGLCADLHPQGHGERRSWVHQERHLHGDACSRCRGSASSAPAQRRRSGLGRDHGLGLTGVTEVTFSGPVTVIADRGDVHLGHGDGAGGSADRRLQRDEPGRRGGEPRSSRSLPKITGFTPRERGGRERDGHRRHGDEPAGADGDADGARSARSTVPPGLITLSTATELQVHGPAGGGDGEDQRDDGGRDGAERDEPDGGAAAAGDRRSPRRRAPVGTTVTISGEPHWGRPG